MAQFKIPDIEVSGAGAILGQLGQLKTRLAGSPGEIRGAQQIRHQVFFADRETVSFQPEMENGIESDDHDRHCDHLIVYEEPPDDTAQIVGTQRFYTRLGGGTAPAFRSQSEFDVESLALRHPHRKFMELGRSCILPAYRNKRTMELMWQGTWAYAIEKQVDVMIGCASFDTRCKESIRDQLEFLVSTSPASDEWHLAPSSTDPIAICPKTSKIPRNRDLIRKLPPLIKGYLRLGAMFSDHAVFDPEFSTIDICVILPVERINQRYIRYYGEDASKHRK